MFHNNRNNRPNTRNNIFWELFGGPPNNVPLLPMGLGRQRSMVAYFPFKYLTTYQMTRLLQKLFLIQAILSLEASLIHSWRQSIWKHRIPVPAFTLSKISSPRRRLHFKFNSLAALRLDFRESNKLVFRLVKSLLFISFILWGMYRKDKS